MIAGYRTLTGRASMLPDWAFGLWQSKNKYNTQAEILRTLEEFRRRQIPDRHDRAGLAVLAAGPRGATTSSKRRAIPIRRR